MSGSVMPAISVVGIIMTAGDDVADQIEAGITCRASASNALIVAAITSNSEAVGRAASATPRMRHEREHHGERARGLGNPVDASANPEPAERESQDERAEHELEGMGGTAEHQAQHPDPGDLVDERGDARRGRLRPEIERDSALVICAGAAVVSDGAFSSRASTQTNSREQRR